MIINGPDKLYVLCGRNPALLKMRSFLLASLTTTGDKEVVYIRSDLCNIEENVLMNLILETKDLCEEFIHRVNQKKRYINMTDNIKDLLERINLSIGK